MELPAWFEWTALAVMVLVLAADVVIAYRRPHVPSTRESGAWIGFYIGLALVFAGILWWVGGAEPAGQFVAGWLTEYSLSVDNLFVFLILLGRFAVPKPQQQALLMGGILIALVLRGVFILIGATLIANFVWIFYLFGAFLIYTAIHQIVTGNEEEAEEEGRIVRFLQKRIPYTSAFHGNRLRTVVDGHRLFTPVLLVLVSLGLTDLIFALDSIPAIFGITQDAFLVFATNLFALMGLRQLYFLLGALVERLVYLKYGIAVILAFIGGKLVLHAMHENELPFLNGGRGIEWAPDIPTWLSLCVIIGSMAVAVVASLVRLRLDRRGAPRHD